MTLSIIVAMTERRVIGRQNQLPWHIPEDLKRFKQITMGHPIIMGRKTFESIGKALPGRQNIVISRGPGSPVEDILWVSDLDEALDEAARAPGGDEAFIIGGAQVFEAAFPRVNKIYLTWIHQDVEGDVFFPALDLEKDFEVVERSERMVSEKSGLPYSYVTAVKKA